MYNLFPLYALVFAILLMGSVLLFRFWRRKSILRLAAGNVVIFLLLLSSAFVVGEGYFYFFYDTTDGAMILLSSKRWIDRHVRYNELDYRGRVPPKASASLKTDELRVCVLGDSFAFGQGIKQEADRLSDIIEDKLRARGMKVSVYNVSRPGWSTRSEGIALEDLIRDGITFGMVILAYVPNDHFDSEKWPEKYRRAVSKAKNPPFYIRPFIDNSLFLSFVYHRLTTFRDPDLQGYDRMALDLYQQLDTMVWHTDYLLHIRDLCALMGARLVVVTLPLTLRPWDQYLFRGVHQDLDRFWREVGVLNVDLLPDFSAYPIKDLIVGQYDTHPNELANRIAADRVVAEVFEDNR